MRAARDITASGACGACLRASAYKNCGKERAGSSCQSPSPSSSPLKSHKLTALGLRGLSGLRSSHRSAIISTRRVQMALGAEMARPFPAAGSGDDEVSAAWAAAPVFLAAETTADRPVDPVIWGDEERMKRELVAWAKAVASMAAAGKNTSSSSTAPRYCRRGRP